MLRSGGLLLALLLALPLALDGTARAAEDRVPLPPMRPPDLGGPEPTPPKDATRPAPAAAPASEAPPARREKDEQAIAEAAALAAERPAFDPAEAQRCEAELRRLGADFAVRPAIEDLGCGAERPLALKALPGGVEVAGRDVLLRCGAALALAKWSEQVVVPSAELHLGTRVESLLVSTSYLCRDRAGSSTPSQHAFANALDLMGLRLSDGRSLLIAPRPDSAAPERAFQAAIRGGACAYFTTVLGPTTDAAHRNHLHLDLKQRKGGYRICQ
ncbi:Uncharacterized conserved protein [Tistlia consotensis]|uniref:Uncharacterized conserved protein n=1 Tax=Tistlia consotensis USBA 355 TaxID=560819 RepID=A0A1Y6CHT0_9PROT|nr:extensin family protein [Tistlia consotensis]SMF53933.1 Uncharacterized conserved protein [Tistlia consotensis USBA 355]SNR86230.1 Uncharacterized conserved protein [Tistlia consotensis]